MGEVWQALDLRLQRAVAVKSLRPGFLPDPAAAERLRAEARAAAMLGGDRLVKVFDTGEHVDIDGRSTPYLVMELVPGVSLAQALSSRGCLPADEVARLIRQVAEALVEAHAAGLVHRDVKPANILVLPSGDVKVTDFGIARQQSGGDLTATGLLVGTARYLAPEQVAGERATAASDVYSLGVVAHEALTGQPMFEGDSDVSVALAHVQRTPPALPAVGPVGLTTLIGAMLAKRPEDRPTAAQLLDEPTGPLPAPTTLLDVGTDSGPGITRRRRALALTGVLSIVGTVSLAALLLGGHRPTEPSTQPTSQAQVSPTAAPSPTASTSVKQVTLTHPSATPSRSPASVAPAAVSKGHGHGKPKKPHH